MESSRFSNVSLITIAWIYIVFLITLCGAKAILDNIKYDTTKSIVKAEVVDKFTRDSSKLINSVNRDYMIQVSYEKNFTDTIRINSYYYNRIDIGDFIYVVLVEEFDKSNGHHVSYYSKFYKLDAS